MFHDSRHLSYYARRSSTQRRTVGREAALWLAGRKGRAVAKQRQHRARHRPA